MQQSSPPLQAAQGHWVQPAAVLKSSQDPALQTLSESHCSQLKPQCRGSVWLFTQAFEQLTRPPLHAATQAPPWQLGVPPEQTFPAPPQLLGSEVRSRQLPPTSVSPGRHSHWPPLQYSRLLHWSPHEPQFFTSLLVSLQLPQHSSPAAHWTPQLPQLSGSTLTCVSQPSATEGLQLSQPWSQSSMEQAPIEQPGVPFATAQGLHEAPAQPYAGSPSETQTPLHSFSVAPLHGPEPPVPPVVVDDVLVVDEPPPEEDPAPPPLVVPAPSPVELVPVEVVAAPPPVEPLANW